MLRCSLIAEFCLVYSITTFIRDIRTLFQIRQVAHLMEHDMQPARTKPHAKEHTDNPVQRPNFRGHAAFGVASFLSQPQIYGNSVSKNLLYIKWGSTMGISWIWECLLLEGIPLHAENSSRSRAASCSRGGSKQSRRECSCACPDQ